jgi:low affinity Fe/Cu permease
MGRQCTACNDSSLMLSEAQRSAAELSPLRQPLRGGSSMRDTTWYSRFAKSIARFSGRPQVFVAAVAVIVIWAVSGPMFGYSDTWQLVINTGTTIITFLMVFLIQSTQNSDTEAMQIKLDELIRATSGANKALLDLEELDGKKLDEFRDRYEALARQARAESEKHGNAVGGQSAPLSRT